MSTSSETSRASTPFLSDTLPPEEVIFGSSPEMVQLRRTIERLAPTDVQVLILGESGVGKDVIAKYVHQQSLFANGPFIRINCPSIPATLIESELFGYERGSFTGAHRTKPGWVELADQGTLFLDEITELELPLQSKLLHLLQDGMYCRIGGQEEQKGTVRILCASNRNMQEEVDSGRFRTDLFYRINVVTLRVPPLRDRRMDIPLLSEYFLGLYNSKFGRNAPQFGAAILDARIEHDWPGNIRELENAIKNYVLLGFEGGVRRSLSQRSPDHGAPVREMPLSRPLSSAASPTPLKELTKKSIREMERRVILDALQTNNWNRKDAARTLGISYRSLFYKMRSAGLSRTKSPVPGAPSEESDREVFPQ
jgi:two-component system response regulator AtoC